MKFRLALKTSGALYDTVKNECWQQYPDPNVDGKKRQDLLVNTILRCQKWFYLGETIILEIDTDKETCTVVKNY